MIDLRNFYFHSDYPVDTLVYKLQGSLTVPNHPSRASSLTITIPHGLDFAPLVRGVWSKDSFSSTARPFGSSPVTKEALSNEFFNSVNWPSQVMTAVYSDATNIYIYVYNTGPSMTFSYRAYGIYGGTDDPDIASNAGLSTPYMLNTDENKLKVWKAGEGTLSVSGGGSDTDTIPHELTYAPAFAVWTKSGSRWGEAGTEGISAISDIITEAYTDTTNLVVSAGTSGNATVNYIYRIYSDG